MESPPDRQLNSEVYWHEVLTHGPRGLLTRGPLGYRMMRWVLRRIPSEARCKHCYVPFTGIVGGAVRLFGFAPSRKNPGMCDF